MYFDLDRKFYFHFDLHSTLTDLNFSLTFPDLDLDLDFHLTMTLTFTGFWGNYPQYLPFLIRAMNWEIVFIHGDYICHKPVGFERNLKHFRFW